MGFLYFLLNFSDILLAPALKIATLNLLAGRVAVGGVNHGFLELSSGPDTLGLPAGLIRHGRDF